MKTGSNWSRKILPLLAWTVFAAAFDDGGGGSNTGPRYTGIVTFRMVGDSTGVQDFVGDSSVVGDGAKGYNTTVRGEVALGGEFFLGPGGERSGGG